MQRAVIAAACALSALLLHACAEPPARQRFALLLRAQSTSGVPVAGVRFWADGRDLGATTAAGSLRAAVRGSEDSAVVLRGACPPAYRTVTPERRLVLRRVHGAAGASAPDVELALHCEPIERVVAVVVIASGALASGLPVRVQGEIVGQTELDGTAHLLVSTAPRTTLRVELDTSQHAALRPRSPVHSFRIEDEDSILLAEQRFTALRRPRPGPRGLGPKRRPPRPQRLE